MPPTFECPICTDDFPRERMISCEGRTTHYYCHNCAKEYAKNIIGSMKGVVTCCSGDCKAELSKKQLLVILEPSLVGRLELNLQNEVLRMANMDDLSDCPFCDFKAVLPPINEDPLFRCQNFEKCGKTSCRKCNKAAHPGLSCKAADKAKSSEAKDANEALLEKLRAELATALSDALICRCNNCKQPFVKSVGCNEMKCQQCSHVQCYVCGESLTNPMDHYGKGNPCKMFDNTADLEDKKVKQAKAAFLKNVETTYPNIKESDLEIKVSKAVEKMEQARLKAWQHPENLIPVEEIERESFGDRNQQRPRPFRLGTAFDEFLAADMAFADGFGDGAFGFGVVFEQPPFHRPPEATRAHSRSITGVAWPGSGQTRMQRTAGPAASASRTQIGTSRMGNTRASTAQLGNISDSRSTLADDVANFLRVSRPAAASTLSRTTGDPGVGSSITGEIRQNAAASSARTQTRAAAGSDRQQNDVAPSNSRPPAISVASSSRTVSTGESNLSRVAVGATATPNNPQHPISTIPARLHATTTQTPSGVLNPSRRTGIIAANGQPYMGRGTSATRILRTRRGNSTGRSNAQSRASLTSSLMFDNGLYPAGIYGMGSYPVPPYGYGHESGFATYEDPYFDDYDDPYKYGYYGGRRYY